jgi:hypothetical protein
MLEHEIKTCNLLREKRIQFENNEKKILKNISPLIIKRISYIIEKINSKLKKTKINAWEFSWEIKKPFESDMNKNMLDLNAYREEQEQLKFHYSFLLEESLILNISMILKPLDDDGKPVPTPISANECFTSYVFFNDSIRLWNFIDSLYKKLSIPINYITDDDFDSSFEKGYIMYKLEKD